SRGPERPCARRASARSVPGCCAPPRRGDPRRARRPRVRSAAWRCAATEQAESPELSGEEVVDRAGARGVEDEGVVVVAADGAQGAGGLVDGERSGPEAEPVPHVPAGGAPERVDAGDAPV